ncbi:MAG: efflux RND transporter periplasmic adaptor subunit [Gammaproteobacteria bacterium]|nr:efflux RND transporter periplasmic adaptor subunit [Gammaproteobacteria bacterium]
MRLILYKFLSMMSLRKTSFTTSLSILLPLIYQPLMAEQTAELDCLVRPEMYIELSSPVETTLKAMLVNVGDTISKGQHLVQLENSVESARVELAKLQASSTSEIENRRIQMQFSKRSFERIQELYSKNSVSRFEKDKAEAELALAKIELLKAREKHQQAQLNLKKVQTELALRTIKSPIDGIIIDSYIKIGESVANRPIMKLAQINPLRVELIAPTEYFGLVKKDMEVEIYPERPVNKTFKATVTVVDQLIDSASGSFTIRMSLPNPGEELIGGVNCIARFDFDEPAIIN